MMTLANYNIAHRVRNGNYSTKFEEFAESMPNMVVCPAGGSYRVELVPAGSFTVHCSVLSHDAGKVEPKGYSPGLNTE